MAEVSKVKVSKKLTRLEISDILDNGINNNLKTVKIDGKELTIAECTKLLQDLNEAWIEAL